jgi:hypothetical protein
MADKKISALTAATTPLAGTEVLPIVQSGATVKVSIADVTAGRAISATSVTTGLGAVGTPAYTFTGDTNTGMWSPTADTIAFSEGGVEAARFDPSGNFLVGTTAIGAIGTANGFRARADGRALMSSATDGVFELGYNGGNATGTIVVFYKGGALGGSITTDGATTGYNVSSDARLKENIADADNTASLIDALQVRKFDWKTNGKHQRYGFVAQELAAVAPEAVYQPANLDEMMGVDYSKLVPMLVKEVQNLRARVAEIEKS